jgi:hypothetical protein
MAARINLESLQLLLRVPLEVGSHELVVNVAPVSCQGGRVRGEQQGLDTASIHAKNDRCLTVAVRGAFHI